MFSLNRSLLRLLAAALLATSGCHEDLSLSQRIRGITVDQVILNLESADPDAVREALVWLSYAEFEEDEQAALESQKRIMALYAQTVRGSAFNPKVPADTLLRCTAARCIARGEAFATDDAIQALIEAMERDDEAMVRADCATALGQLRRAGTAAPIVRTLHTDPSPDVRMAAARALAHFKPRRADTDEKGPAPADYKAALDGLLARLNDRNGGVRRVTCESLRALTGEKIDPTPEAWLAWQERRRTD